ncbi:acyl-CoA dehydrogenase family protein [Arvimicrobium flavum]|uniref:acyl-CoA dehydrogenase family protein n=1 Tax=Arvimicrobium flavum TaxID=3393320 RepID=UPI00237C44ED|nr:acyl-CoA dehydrogenase family protein [Mesorhizobium shangrilense]
MLALLSDEQRMFEDTAVRIANDVRITNMVELRAADSDSFYGKLGDNGLLGLRMRSDGAPLGSGVEVAIAAQALGAALAPVPFTASGVLAPELLVLAGADDALIEQLSTGERRCGLLLDRSLVDIAGPDAADSIAFDVQGASHAVAIDRSKGTRQVVLVDLASGFEPTSCADLTRQMLRRTSGELRVEPIGRPVSDEDFDRWLALALVTVAADIAGVLHGAHQGVVAYTKERVQYGALIGSFQAVQHICAEMLVEVEAIRDLVSRAAWCVDALPAAEALANARTAKALASAAARPTAEAVMQVYGGIGQTWEHVAHICARRVMVDAELFGGADHQLDAIADQRLGAN